MTGGIEARKAIARAIIQKGALTVTPDKPIRWASGYAMPVYIDNRCLIGFPEVRTAIAEAFVAMIAETGATYDAVAGVATGAIPHATTLADMLGLPLLYIRAKAKDHGTSRMVEGAAPGSLVGKRVLVIEDTISTGGSAVSAIESVRKEGAIADTCAVIYHHDLPGKESPFAAMTPPCSLNSLLTFSFLLATAKEENLLDSATITELENWYADPFSWGEAHGMPRVQ